VTSTVVLNPYVYPQIIQPSSLTEDSPKKIASKFA